MVTEAEREVEVEISPELAVIIETVDGIAGGLYAIAAAINRLADATAGEEVGPPEEEMGYLDGKR